MDTQHPDIVREHWRNMMAAAQAHPTESPQQMRTRVDRLWPSLTAEPGAIDYHEIDIEGLPAMWVTPHDADDDQVIFAIHGGGGVSGSIYTHRKLLGHLAKASGSRAILISYRQQPYPRPIENTYAAYSWLLGEGIDPQRTALVADSFGASLALATMLRAREAGVPLAAGMALLSPWVDMTVSSDTFESNAATEEFFYKPVVSTLAAAYVANADPTLPLVSPVNADLQGLPPMYIQVGGDETLLGEAVRLTEAARAAGVQAAIDVFPHQLHTFQMAAGHSSEADKAINSLARWVRQVLAR
jgi:acetyl esterase/lipase